MTFHSTLSSLYSTLESGRRPVRPDPREGRCHLQLRQRVPGHPVPPPRPRADGRGGEGVHGRGDGAAAGPDGPPRGAGGGAPARAGPGAGGAGAPTRVGQRGVLHRLPDGRPDVPGCVARWCCVCLHLPTICFVRVRPLGLLSYSCFTLMFIFKHNLHHTQGHTFLPALIQNGSSPTPAFYSNRSRYRWTPS